MLLAFSLCAPLAVLFKKVGGKTNTQYVERETDTEGDKDRERVRRREKQRQRREKDKETRERERERDERREESARSAHT